MPLPLPNLDDRRWTDLVEEGRALVPRYAPRWTDHNLHDPGITLMELLAWLVEQDIYRLNRVPERHRRKFLGLIGFELGPPRAAQTVLSFTPEPGTAPVTLPIGAEFEAVDKELTRFRTLRALDVAVVTLAAVQVQALDRTTGTLVFRDRTGDWREGLGFEVFGWDPRPGAALYLGFSELPAERPVALAFRFQGPGNDTEERQRVICEAAAQRLACRPVFPDIHCPEETARPAEPEDALPAHHSARIVWEVFTGPSPNDWKRLDPVMMPARLGVGQVMDDTRSLTLDGIVEVNLPSTMVKTTLGATPSSLFYLRCRVVEGAYDAPPVLADVAPNGVIAEQAVPVWQSFVIPAGVTPGGPIPSLGRTVRLRMKLDKNGAVQALALFDAADPTAAGLPDIPVLSYRAPAGSTAGQLTLEAILGGFGTGRPGQQIVLPQAPLQVESLQLYTHAGDDWQEWTRRENLDASTRTDFHFVLDATSGELHFGDGERGRVPPEGAAILALYRVTRAGLGNIPANMVVRPAAGPRNDALLAGLPVTIKDQLSRITTNRTPATGGAAAETLAAATGRAVETLHAHERLLDLCSETKCQTLDQVDRGRVRVLRAPTRAVNLLDIERLALDVPGTRIARARAWANNHPAYPCLEAPGVVTVVILPDIPVARPIPSEGLLRAVSRYLDRRRIIATRVEVVGPQYLEVRVNVRVRARPHTDRGRIKDQIEQALDIFLDPRRGGPAGLGWPFGRDVYRSEILQLIDNVPGVDHVLELSLSAGTGEPRCGNLALCPTWLVTLGRHRIEVISALSPEIRVRAGTGLPPCSSPNGPGPVD